ncbi:MAG: helix-turn-helix domain-containing protein [Suipraeoptans sp.]
MTVGENIKKIRKQKGLTQKRLGELCGMNEVQIRQYELGKANPKIETVDKIASALGVKIVDIMEQFTMEQWKNTSEFQKIDKTSNAIIAIIAVLTDIYGKVEDKDVMGDYFSSNYYLVGEGEKQFILYEDDIDALYESTKASIPSLVNRMKDNRPESEVIRELLEECSDKEAFDKIPDKYK